MSKARGGIALLTLAAVAACGGVSVRHAASSPLGSAAAPGLRRGASVGATSSSAVPTPHGVRKLRRPSCEPLPPDVRVGKLEDRPIVLGGEFVIASHNLTCEAGKVPFYEATMINLRKSRADRPYDPEVYPRQTFHGLWWDVLTSVLPLARGYAFDRRLCLQQFSAEEVSREVSDEYCITAVDEARIPIYTLVRLGYHSQRPTERCDRPKQNSREPVPDGVYEVRRIAPDCGKWRVLPRETTIRFNGRLREVTVVPENQSYTIDLDAPRTYGRNAPSTSITYPVTVLPGIPGRIFHLLRYLFDFREQYLVRYNGGRCIVLGGVMELLPAGAKDCGVPDDVRPPSYPGPAY